MVLASARNLLASSDRVAQWSEVLRIWAMVAKELDGLPLLPLDCPGEQDAHALARLLHAAVNVGDGLGFDVIEVGTHPGQVWLTEVKSAVGGRLFLSENERLKALQYEKTAPGRWRLKVWLGDGQWADPHITASVLAILRDIDLRLDGNAQARAQIKLSTHLNSALLSALLLASTPRRNHEQMPLLQFQQLRLGLPAQPDQKARAFGR